MADEVKVSRFGNASKNFSKFIREVRTELKKVIWPNRQQLTNNTFTVLAACVVVGIMIWVADLGLLKLSELLFLKK